MTEPNATPQSPNADPENSLTVVDIGHGSCCVLTDASKTILVDAGPGSAVLEYLRQQAITRIDCLILSHSDGDHIRGAIALLGNQQFEVLEVILNSDGVKTTGAWANLVWELDNRRRNGSIRLSAQLRQGDSLPTQLDGMELTVLAPRDGLVLTGPGARDKSRRLITSNTMSAVILVSTNERRIALLTGDLDETGLENLLETNQSLKADILIFPHHGGLAGSSADAAKRFASRLTSAVEPHEVIFSLDRQRYGNPRPEIIEGVREAAPSARIACTQLSTRCALDIPGDSPIHLLPLFAKGRDRNSCCAGTMRISLKADSSMKPAAKVHGGFISQFAETALCLRKV